MVVFVSYQRADSIFAAHAVGYACRLGDNEVFVDTGSIQKGELFFQSIRSAIGRSNVMLAMIGSSFSYERLSDPSNVVAFEWRQARLHGVSVIPVLVGEGVMPSDSDLPAELRWFTRRNAYSLRKESLSGDISNIINDIPMLATTPRQNSRVLWVDDEPSNNEYERTVLRSKGVIFDTVVSTSEAIDQLINETYDLVISDLSRSNSSDSSVIAGEDLLAHEVIAQGGPPVVIYGGMNVVMRMQALSDMGASLVTSNQVELINGVLDILGRKSLSSESV